MNKDYMMQKDQYAFARFIGGLVLLVGVICLAGGSLMLVEACGQGMKWNALSQEVRNSAAGVMQHEVILGQIGSCLMAMGTGVVWIGLSVVIDLLRAIASK